MSALGECRSISLGRDAIGSTIISGNGNILVMQAAGMVRDEPQDQLPDAKIGPNPYKGLLAFHEEDAERFFGREKQTNRLWELFRKLHDPPPHNQSPMRLLPILGPSGSGKSSVARAGLIPELARRPLPGWKKARVAVLTPGSHPLEALAAVLARVATGETAALRKSREFVDELRIRSDQERYDGLRRIAAAIPEIASTPLIVLVDQFEEIYSLCIDADERNTFVDNLLCAGTDPAAHVSIIITLRTDFLEDTQKHSQLNVVIASQGMIIPSMNEDELRQAITEPARLAGHPLDEATVELLINETEGREGALPLLEFALTRIWNGLTEGVAPADTLKSIGGVGGALAGEAQRIYDNLPEVERHIARRVFLGLVQLGEGTRDTRRRVVVPSLVASGEDPDQVEEVVRRFSAPGVRLITLSSESHGHETAEVTHEALFEHWEQLDEWLARSRDDLRFQRRLDQAARHWDSQSRAGGLLWRSPDLDYLRAFHQRAGKDMTDVQMAFYNTSLRAQNKRRIVVATATLLTIALAVTSLGLYFHADKGWQEAAAGWGEAEIAKQELEAKNRELADNNHELERKKEEAEDAYRQLNIESAKRTAAIVMAGLGQNYEVSASEFGSLGVLAESEPEIRLLFLEQLLTHEGTAERLQYRYKHMLHATVGLDREMKERIKQLLLQHGETPSPHRAINLACGELGALLDRGDSELNYMAAINHLAAMEKPADPPALPSTPDLARFAEQLQADQAAALAEQILTAMEQAGPPTDEFFGYTPAGPYDFALDNLAGKLSPDQAANSARRILVMMSEANDLNHLRNLGERLPNLTSRLTAQQATACAEQIGAIMDNTNDPYAWFSLADARGRFYTKLPAQHALALVDYIMRDIAATTDPSQVCFPARALGSMGKHVRAEQAEFAAGRICSALEQNDHPITLELLAMALDRLWEVVPADKAAAGAPSVAAAMERTTSPHTLVSLSAALSKLGPQLPDESAATAAKQIVAAMAASQETTTENWTITNDLQYLGNALHSLGEKVPSEHAAAAARQIVTSLENQTSSEMVGLPDLGVLLDSLIQRLSAEEAASLAKRIVTYLGKTAQDADGAIPSGFAVTDPSIPLLGERLISLGEKLSPAQAEELARQIVSGMNTNDADAFAQLAMALDGLGAKLPAAQAAEGVGQILAALERNHDPVRPFRDNVWDGVPIYLQEPGAGDALVAPDVDEADDPASPFAANPLGGLGGKLPADQSLPFAQQLADAMRKTRNHYRYLFLADALDSWGEKLSAQEAETLAPKMLAGMHRTPEPLELAIRARVLGGLGQKLSAAQAATAAELVSAALERTADPFSVYSLGLALDRLWESFPDEQAAVGTGRIVETMKKINDPHALVSLIGALTRLGSHLPPEHAAEAARQIMVAMEQRAAEAPKSLYTYGLPDPGAIGSLDGALGSLGELLPATEAAALAEQIVATMETDAPYNLTDALGRVVTRLSDEDAMSVLKSLPCVDINRGAVLEGLETKANTEFNDNLWKAVEWAEKQGVDIEKVRRFPIREDQ